MELKHESDLLISDNRQLRIIQVMGVLPADENRRLRRNRAVLPIQPIRPIEPPQQIQPRALARPRSPDDRNLFTSIDREIDTFEDMRASIARAEKTMDVLRAEQRAALSRVLRARL
jgi:hypothetical protein